MKKKIINFIKNLFKKQIVKQEIKTCKCDENEVVKHLVSIMSTTEETYESRMCNEHIRIECYKGNFVEIL